MGTLSLIVKEVLYRKLNAILGLLGVVVAVMLFVFFFTAGEGSRLETARVMRDLGMNLRVIPADTDMNRFWVNGFSDRTLPEEYVDRLASHEGLSYSHLLPTLKQKVAWHDREVVLVGVGPEVSPVDKKKPSMSSVPDPGGAYLGHELATRLGLKKGDAVDFLGEKLKVAACLPESGTDQDISIILHLRDVQRLVKLEGKINEIQALDCVCLVEGKDSLQILRDELSRVLPDARVLQVRAMSDTRERQRKMVEDYLAVVLPFVLVAAAAWVGVLALLNVRERWREIGILRALGHGSGKIAVLFLGKAVILGFLGAAIGFAAGTSLALALGPSVFQLTAAKIQPLYHVLGWAFVLTPVFTAISSVLPTLLAVMQDPAVALRHD